MTGRVPRRLVAVLPGSLLLLCAGVEPGPGPRVGVPSSFHAPAAGNTGSGWAGLEHRPCDGSGAAPTLSAALEPGVPTGPDGSTAAAAQPDPGVFAERRLALGVRARR